MGKKKKLSQKDKMARIGREVIKARTSFTDVAWELYNKNHSYGAILSGLESARATVMHAMIMDSAEERFQEK